MGEVRTQELRIMEQRLRQATVTSERLNKKFSVVQKEIESTQKDRLNLAKSKNNLEHELEAQRLQALKDHEEADKYRKLCESMKQKIEKLEDGVKVAKTNQASVQKAYKEKSEKLKKTQMALEEIKVKTPK